VAPDSGQRYFEPDFFEFLRGISKNNNREWFNANKTRYETSVRDASLRFVRAIGPKLGTLSRHLVADPRPVGGSVMRIYRDIRFSKDKSPYRTSVGIHFFHEVAKQHEGGTPGFFLHLHPGESAVMAGAWQPEPKDTKKIRESIVQRANTWKKILRSGIALDGESLKRVPPGFDTDHELASDLKRKDFVTSKGLKDSEVTSRAFESTFLSACREMNPLNRFLAEATGLDW
jgi:uncharacterized protein (TIGR02453 family)